jgi:hypothetical protein
MIKKLLILIKNNIKNIITYVSNNKQINTVDSNISVKQSVKQNYISNTHYSVIKLILELKNIENDLSCFTVLQKEDEIYNTFEKYIIENSNGENIPDQKELKEILGIETRQGIELRKKALEKGIIVQLQNKKYKLNKNSEILDNYNLGGTF